MKMSDQTLNILKNFAGINSSLLFRAGKTQRTISPTKDIIAVADIDADIENQFAIFDLNRFLGVLSLTKNPELQFGDKFLAIETGTSSVRYVYADPKLILKAPDKDLTMPSVDVEFDLDTETLQSVLKAASVMGLGDISFVGEAGKLFIRAHDKKSDTSDEYKVELGTAPKGASFHFDFKAENFKLLPGKYSVQLSSKKIAKLETKGVKYWLAAVPTSEYSAG